MTARLVNWARAWKLELAIALVVTVTRAVLSSIIGFGPADAAYLAAVTAAVLSRPARQRATRLLVVARSRRRWFRALTAVWAPPDTPAIVAAGAQPYGPWVTVRVAAGTTVDDLTRRADHLAAWLAVNTVRVLPHPDNAALAAIQALAVDPLAGPGTMWPWINAETTDLWQPIPVAIDDHGQPVTVSLAGHNLLVGGEPGSGKSVALSQLVAAAALDPNTALYLLDGKLVELAAWAHAADGSAGTDINTATDLLREIQSAMETRYQWLLDNHRRKIDPGTTLGVVVIDELAHYLTWPDKKPRDAFADTLRDLVSRGRAAGIVVIAATQKPSSDVIPTSLRDLFGYRWALRCTTPAASDTILGAGHATNGHTASTIPPAVRGGGYLLHESGQPIRCRAHHLTDTDIDALAHRGAELRQQHRLAGQQEGEVTDPQAPAEESAPDTQKRDDEETGP